MSLDSTDRLFVSLMYAFLVIRLAFIGENVRKIRKILESRPER